jgi:hypothetical protein
MTVLKLITLPYAYLAENIFVGLGEITYICVLSLKFNDYNNFELLQAEEIGPHQWIEHGWITMIFEILFLFCYLIAFFQELIIGCIER